MYAKARAFKAKAKKFGLGLGQGLTSLPSARGYESSQPREQWRNTKRPTAIQESYVTYAVTPS